MDTVGTVYPPNANMQIPAPRQGSNRREPSTEPEQTAVGDNSEDKDGNPPKRKKYNKDREGAEKIFAAWAAKGKDRFPIGAKRTHDSFRKLFEALGSWTFSTLFEYAGDQDLLTSYLEGHCTSEQRAWAEKISGLVNPANLNKYYCGTATKASKEHPKYEEARKRAAFIANYLDFVAEKLSKEKDEALKQKEDAVPADTTTVPAEMTDGMGGPPFPDTQLPVGKEQESPVRKEVAGEDNTIDSPTTKKREFDNIWNNTTGDPEEIQSLGDLDLDALCSFLLPN